jgi:hypothetical protein
VPRESREAASDGSALTPSLSDSLSLCINAAPPPAPPPAVPSPRNLPRCATRPVPPSSSWNKSTPSEDTQAKLAVVRANRFDEWLGGTSFT